MPNFTLWCNWQVSGCDPEQCSVHPFLSATYFLCSGRNRIGGSVNLGKHQEQFRAPHGKLFQIEEVVYTTRCVSFATERRMKEQRALYNLYNAMPGPIDPGPIEIVLHTRRRLKMIILVSTCVSSKTEKVIQYCTVRYD